MSPMPPSDSQSKGSPMPGSPMPGSPMPGSPSDPPKNQNQNHNQKAQENVQKAVPNQKGVEQDLNKGDKKNAAPKEEEASKELAKWLLGEAGFSNIDDTASVVPGVAPTLRAIAPTGAVWWFEVVGGRTSNRPGAQRIEADPVQPRGDVDALAHNDVGEEAGRWSEISHSSPPRTA